MFIRYVNLRVVRRNKILEFCQGDGDTTFKVMKNLEQSDSSGDVDDEFIFPVPYDFPLTNYFKQGEITSH